MGKKSILIVEDELITAMDIQMRLSEHGYDTIDCVATGEEAINLVKNRNFDLILMDVKLKGVIDGIRTTKLIKKRFNIPIVYISGNTDMHISHRLKATNPVGIIRKPINEKELFECVDRLLNTV